MSDSYQRLLDYSYHLDPRDPEYRAVQRELAAMREDQRVAKTTHTCGGPKWGHLTPGCARCDELAKGAPARQGWGSQKRQEAARFTRDLKAHNCAVSGCGPVCTFGDW